MILKRMIEIDMKRCLKGLRKGKRFIFFCTLLCGILGILLALFVVKDENEYDATATVYSIAYGSYAESEQGVYAIRKYSDIIKSYRVAERAALLLADSSVTKEDIYEMIHVESLVVEGTTYLYENNSSVIRLHAVDENQNLAMQVVNAVADAFVLEVNSLSDAEATQVLDYAYTADVAYNASQTQMLVMVAGVLAGFFLGCLVILYRILFSGKIVSVNEASLHSKLEVVGVIPRF